MYSPTLSWSTKKRGFRYFEYSILHFVLLGLLETWFLQVTKLFEALDKEEMRKKTEEEEEEEEGQTLIDHENGEQNNTEMIVVIDNVTD